MRRHNNLFDQITSTDNLRLAYRKARKGKTSKSAIKRFDTAPEKRLARIQSQLIDGTFNTSRYQTKWVFEPKQRLIYVLPFNPDRIVQHAIMNVIEPIWDSMLISDTYACRSGKGIHAGSRRVMEFVRRYKYCLKCDVSKFYPSVDHDILFGIIQRKIKCRRTLELLQNIIYSIGGGKNVPIGNYTSQWFGNLYLNELDQYLKHKYRIKPYVRYCDDFVLFADDKAILNKMAHVIKDFVWTNLNLRFPNAIFSRSHREWTFSVIGTSETICCYGKARHNGSSGDCGCCHYYWNGVKSAWSRIDHLWHPAWGGLSGATHIIWH